MWAERLKPAAVVHALHPGWADTPGVEQGLPSFRKLTRPILRTPAQGADTLVWLLWADEPLASSGDLWLDRRRRSTTRIPRHWHHRRRAPPPLDLGRGPDPALARGDFPPPVVTDEHGA